MFAFMGSEEYDILGHVDLLVDYDGTDWGETTRRVNRIATLDGGVVFNDWGFVDGDRTITLSFRTDKALSEKVDRIARIHRRVVLSTERGCYKGAIESFVDNGETGEITFLVDTRLDEA